MKQLNISYEGETLYSGGFLELTPLGVNIECHFDLIEKLKTNNGKFKVVSFELDSNAEIGSIKGELCVHCMRKVRQDTCLMSLRFFHPRQEILARVKQLIAFDKGNVAGRLSTVKQAEFGVSKSLASLSDFQEKKAQRVAN